MDTCQSSLNCVWDRVCLTDFLWIISSAIQLLWEDREMFYWIYLETFTFRLIPRCLKDAEIRPWEPFFVANECLVADGEFFREVEGLTGVLFDV